jgi:iron complex outermembrane recepter protein
MPKTSFATRLLQTTILAGAVAAFATPVLAEGDDAIVITGTRIDRADLEAPLPIASFDGQELALINTVNTEQFINTLPQVIPGFDATSNNPGDGTATVDIRGLGTSRTLVLVDGNRWVSFDGGGVVDLNSIPASMVQQIDIVTGGASAIYGSDAVAGVVNFILRTDFEGLEISSSYQTTGEQDGDIFDINLIAGGSFADGRGNAVISFGYTDRQPVFQGDRSFSAIANDDNGTGFDPFGSSGVPGTRLFDGFDFTGLGYTTDGTTCTAPSGGSAEGLSGTCTGGATFDGNGDPIPWINSGPNTTRYNYAPVNYLQLPQERYNAAGFVTYDITDDIIFKGRTVFSSNVVARELAPTRFFDTVTIGPGSGGVTQSVRDLITSNGGFTDNNANGVFDGTDTYGVFIGRLMSEVGPRNASSKRESLQLAGSLEGTWLNDWDWNVFGSFSKTAAAEIQTGNVSISAMQDAVLNQGCNIFGENNLSPTCVDLVSRKSVSILDLEQVNIIAVTDGALGITMPAAENPLQLVLGVEYRENFSDFKPDSVLGPDVAGFNRALPIKGRTSVSEIFGELYVPLIEGAAFAEELSLNAAYRYSDYATFGGLDTYAIGAEWAPNSQIRFRTQFQRAARAPNINELFRPVTSGFPFIPDPCSSGSTGTFNDPQNVPHQAAIIANCIANGVPAAIVGTPFLPGIQLEALYGGNPNLVAETADTITVSFVVQPEAVPDLVVSVDYYQIKIDNYINNSTPPDLVMNECFLNGDARFCALVTRRAGGIIDFVELTDQNLSYAKSEGIDLRVEYGWDLGEMGDLTFDLFGSYKMSSEFQLFSNTPVVDCTGYFDANYRRCGEPEPEWKHVTQLNWTKGDMLASLRWRYIGETRVDDFISPGFSGSTGLFVDSIDAYNYFDLTGSYTLSENLTLNAGILNLADQNPPILGDCCSEQANTWPATYGPLGRSFFVGAKANF